MPAKTKKLPRCVMCRRPADAKPIRATCGVDNEYRDKVMIPVCKSCRKIACGERNCL
jgi:hypothetical protein